MMKDGNTMLTAVLNHTPLFVALSKNLSEEFLFVNDFGRKLFEFKPDQSIKLAQLCIDLLDEEKIRLIELSIIDNRSWLSQQKFVSSSGRVFIGNARIDYFEYNLQKYYLCSIEDIEESVKVEKEKLENKKLIKFKFYIFQLIYIFYFL